MLAVTSADRAHLKSIIIIQKSVSQIQPFECEFTPDQSVIDHSERKFIHRTLMDHRMTAIV
jgi:hypothetical protein